MNDELLLIIDGSSLLSTQFYGNLPPAVLMGKTPEEKEAGFPKIMQTSTGVYTNGIFGFLRYLLKMLEQQKPTHLAVTWDLTRDTFRREMYSEYKGNRSETMVPLKEQFRLCQEILGRIGIRQYMSETYEADDYSGSLTRRFEQEIPVAIVTKDHDYLQLADDNTTIWLLQTAQKKADELFDKYHIKKKETNCPEKAFPMTPERIRQEFGVTPAEIAELKGLQGDSSDNIKGVPGIGPQTAVALIAYYKTVDRLYEAIHEAGPDGEKNLAQFMKDTLGIKRNPIPTLTKTSDTELCGEQAARLSEKLATIKQDIPIEETLDNLKIQIDYREFAKVLHELEITSITLPQTEPAAERKPVAICYISDRTDLDRNRAEILSCQGPVGLARKTRKNAQEEWQIAFGLSADESFITLASDSTVYFISDSDPGMHRDAVTLLTDLCGQTRLYAFHVKEEWCDLPYTENLWDVSLMDYLLRPLTTHHEYEDVFAEWMPNAATSSEDEAEAVDARELGILLDEKLTENGGHELYQTIEQPLMWVLHDMENAGILVDRSILREYADSLQKKMEEEQARIYELAECSFNINSPKQLGEVLFEKMNLPYPKKTKKGYSTSVEILETLTEYPIVEHILLYRQYSKLLSTYAEGLQTCISADGRIHTNYQQMVTATGRLSSTEPNLQNIPIRSELGREIRKAFVPKPGFVFVDADYSQIELRLMAHMSGDTELQKAYNSAADIHRLTASQVFNVPFDDVTPEQRSAAKAVNFGILYGISSFSLSKDLGITKSMAERYIQDYFARFPKMKEYLDKTVASAKELGYVTTMFGRRRPIPELTSSVYTQRSFGERVAMNSPIQGTAADIMKIAMIKVYQALQKSGTKAKMLIQVHDELLLEVPQEEAESVSELLREAMETAVLLTVPLEADVQSGMTWYDAK